MAAATESSTTDPCDPCVESSTVSCDPCGDVSTALIEQPAATEQQPIKSSKQDGDATQSNGIPVTPLSVLEKKIIRQVEFYFGDRNMSRDKFLQEKIKEDDGWVSLDVLLTFNRLKSLSTDPAIIVAALRKSTGGVVEVSDDGTKIRRISTLPTPSISLLSPEQRSEMRDRTAYLKGFPEDSTLDEIQDLLDQYGEVILIQMRKMRPPDDKFKGSVFAEFKSKESVTSLLSAGEIQFRGSHVLQVETKEEWFKRKTEERKKLKHNKLGNLEEQEEEEEEENKQKTAVAQTDKVKKEGCILHLTNVGADVTREILKEHFRQYAAVAYVDFQKGDDQGYVRFDEEGGAKKAISDGNVTQLCGADVNLRMLEGEEEQRYWEDSVNQRRKKFGGNRRGGRGGRGGGWRGGRRGGKRPSADQREPSSKRVKDEP